jgi:hypothetical protein
VSNITPERINIQQEETAYRAAVSEATLTRVGASINFINAYQANLREFMINGSYGGASNFLGVDGLVRFPYNWELLDVYIYTMSSTSGTGTTELDIKWKPFSSGSYSSIFTTTPKFTSSASTFETCGVGQTKTGFTAPVLSKTLFDANDQLRIDLIQSVLSGVGTGLGIVFRPR